MRYMSNLGPERIQYDKFYCKHRRVIVKRWSENGKFFAILRCRWCDEPWIRKEIVLDQNSHHGLKLITTKFTEVGSISTESSSQ